MAWPPLDVVDFLTGDEGRSMFVPDRKLDTSYLLKGREQYQPQREVLKSGEREAMHVQGKLKPQSVAVTARALTQVVLHKPSLF
jgi:hypothetical protein